MARTHGTKEMWLDELRADGPAFLAAAEQADATAAGAAAPVPSCPGWTMADLVHHLGGVYQHVLLHSARGVTERPGRRLRDFIAEPVAADLLNWWNDWYTSIMSTLGTLDPELPAWNWAPQAKKAIFWHRRMAHETAIHRWDAQMAVGWAEPIEERYAADGVAEVLDTFLPAGRRINRGATATGLVALQATDADYTWHVRLRGEGVALLDTDTIFGDDELRARVVAAGLASNLMLALWGRVAWDTLEVSGDEALLGALRVG